MFLSLLVSLFCVAHAGDTLDVATVSVHRNAAAAALSPVQAMSEVEMERLGTVGLYEALNRFSGVNVKDYGGVGGLKTVSVRNMGAAHTSVVYDGIAISDAQNGQVDISRFNLDDISSVSMSIGLDDDIFCSARHLTSAGVLRLETLWPSFSQGSTEVNARMTFGSFNTYNPYLSLRRRFNAKYSLRAALNGGFSRGDYPYLLENGQIATLEKRVNSDVQSYGAEADFYADWSEGGRLKAKVNVHASERGLPGSVVLYTSNAYERLWDRSVISNVMYDRDLGQRWRFHADAGFSNSFNRHLDTDPAYPEAQDSRYSQNEASLAARAMFMPVSAWKLVLAEDIYCNTLSSNIPECPFPVRLSSVSALSAQYERTSFKATASLVGTYMTESLRSGSASQGVAARFRLSPAVGLSWNVFNGFFLRASYKEGFRMPTFNDLYYARVGNRNLRPEIARQTNIGLAFSGTYDWGCVDLTADGYCNFIKDKIVAVPTMFIWKMRNVGEVDMYGTDVTASLRWRLAKWLTLHVAGNYSLQYALDMTDPASKSYMHQIPYTPRHCGGGDLTLEMLWVNLSYKVNAVGRRYVLNQNIPANEIAAYADHGLSLNRAFDFGREHDYRIYVGLEALNLSGLNYEVIRYYPMPGRSFRLTLKFKY